MSSTFTLNGTLGRSDSSSARQVLKDLAFASLECAVEHSDRYVLRFNAPGGTPANTTVPITLSFGPVTNPYFIYIHVTNNTTIRVNSLTAVSPHQSVDFVLGGPEGALILFGKGVTNVQIIATDTDLSEVDFYIAGV
jgi:hypothetical protein